MSEQITARIYNNDGPVAIIEIPNSIDGVGLQADAYMKRKQLHIPMPVFRQMVQKVHNEERLIALEQKKNCCHKDCCR
jgi:hypothetical protein